MFWALLLSGLPFMVVSAVGALPSDVLDFALVFMLVVLVVELGRAIRKVEWRETAPARIRK